MILEMKKFGHILNGRPSAREDVLRVKQIIPEKNGEIVIDFKEIQLITPSYADEFVNGLKKLFPDTKVSFSGIEENQVLKDTLSSLKLL